MNKREPGARASIKDHDDKEVSNDIMLVISMCIVTVTITP